MYNVHRRLKLYNEHMHNLVVCQIKQYISSSMMHAVRPGQAAYTLVLEISLGLPDHVQRMDQETTP